MNINSFKSLDLEEKEIFKKIYFNLHKGCPLLDNEFEILDKAYNEISIRVVVDKST